MQSEPPAEDQNGGQWYTLKQAAEILGKSKKTIEHHAGKLNNTDRRTDAESGLILISGAALDRIRQKSRTSTRQVPDNCPITTQDRLTSTPQVPDSRNLPTQQVPHSEEQPAPQVPDNYPISTPQVPNSTAETAALDILKEQIKGLTAELLQLKSELKQAQETAAQAQIETAKTTERLHAAQERAERAEAALDAEKVQNQTLTEQLATIADKQADAIRAGAAKQLALAIPADQTAGQEKPGFIARLFHRRKEKG